MSKYFILALALLINSYLFSQNQHSSPIPKSSYQLILVTADSVNSFRGYLQLFERVDAESEWNLFYTQVVYTVIGRSGLAWGKGLHKLTGEMQPVKKEGDGKSPAGIFLLGSAFGYDSLDSMKHLRIPYLHVTQMLECVDDVKSDHYNTLVYRDRVENVDWESSEKMREYGIYYELGVVVEQNSDPIENGSGSCIFLHNWKSPDEPMAGCTAMNPLHMKFIVNWLDINKHPVLVQLTNEWYNQFKDDWELP